MDKEGLAVEWACHEPQELLPARITKEYNKRFKLETDHRWKESACDLPRVLVEEISL